jgi:putative solute:sodium symporter small subunit
MRPRILPDLSEAAHAFERRYGVGGLKRGLLGLLAGWIAYFIAINMFIRSLNKVIVPVLDLPLGIFMAMQGAVVIFVVALVFLTKWQAATVATVRIRSRHTARR